MFITRKQLTYENERLEQQIKWMQVSINRLSEVQFALLDHLNLEMETVKSHVSIKKRKSA